MYKIYEILSGEEWNGQTSPDDFAETKLVAEVNTLQECYNWIEDHGGEKYIYR